MRDLDAVDLKLLRVFEAVAAERNVTRAAARLGLTQATVSHAVGRLREIFGDELFVRSPSGVEPTALATELSGPIEAALRQLRSAITSRSEFDPARTECLFALGMTDHAELVFGPDLASVLSTTAPHASLSMKHTEREQAARLVDEDAIQVALGALPEPPSRMTQIMLLRDGFATVMRPDHPAAGEPLTLDRFLAYPHLTIGTGRHGPSEIDRAVEAVGRRRRVAVVASHLLAAGPMLLASDLMSTMSGRVAEALARSHGLAVRPAPLELAPVRVSMIWHRRYDQQQAHVWLRRTIAGLARKLRAPGIGSSGPDAVPGDLA